MTNPNIFTSPRQQFAALAAAAAITVSLLASMGQLADGYYSDAHMAAAPAAGASSPVAQAVQVVGQRATGV